MRHFWLDRIIECEPGRRAAGVKAVSLAEDHFEAHFPGNPVLPGVCVLEGLAQTAGVLLWQTHGADRLALLVSAERVRFQSFARPGELLRLEAEIESLNDPHGVVRCTATAAGRPIVAARLSFVMVEADQLIAPEYRPQWSRMLETWLGRYPEIAAT
jgi:3-hydroxymyristoyl/3-hydroxydecanoyl-(acyl carrier protein) dehydratase